MQWYPTMTQPLFVRASEETGGSLELRAPLWASSNFSTKSSRGDCHLPRRLYDLGEQGESPAVLVWTDAMWEPSQKEAARLAFVVRFPGSGKGDGARWYYGDMNTPNEVMVRFGCRKNYIGQLEILAAVAVYFSMPELRGRRVSCTGSTTRGRLQR